jgi:hypothetical protein
MTFHLDQIDELRKRANVSYEDAKEALEKCNGDIVEALVYLEKQNKFKFQQTYKEKSQCTSKIKDLIKKGNRVRFLVKKKETTILNLSVNISILITLFAPYITFFGLILALVTGHRIKFEGFTGCNVKVNETLDKVSDTIDSMKKKITEDDENKASSSN